MDSREDDRSSTSGALKLAKLTRDAWVPFAKLIMALFGIKLCRTSMRVERAAVTAATYPGSASLAAALSQYDDNQKCYDLLMLSMANCNEGRTVLSGYEYMPGHADAANPCKYADDGRGAYFRLEHNAMGGAGIDTGAYYMREVLRQRSSTLSIKERVAAHREACHRMMQCEGITLDKLLTQHLVYTLGNDAAYVVVTHECSKNVTYNEAYNMIMECNARLELSAADSAETASAFVARPPSSSSSSHRRTKEEQSMP